jgi:hypothetical protein
VTDDIDKKDLVVDVSCVDWMMRWIDYISKELHLSILIGHLYIVRENMQQDFRSEALIFHVRRGQTSSSNICKGSTCTSC